VHFSNTTCAAGGLCLLIHGIIKSVRVTPVVINQNAGFGRLDFTGYMKKKNQSKGIFIGNLVRSAGSALVAGLMIDTISIMTITTIVITLGVLSIGREHLMMCMPISISMANGKAECKKCKRKKSIPLRDSLLRKDLDGGSIKRGTSFNSSDVFRAINWAL
jgi:hypothetical protein